jgi:hypothetical protein
MGITVTATCLGSVLLRRLIEDADARRVPYEQYDIKDGFARLAERDTTLGGGPLHPDEVDSLESIDCEETLAELIEQAAAATEHRKPLARLALLDIEGEPVLMLTHPIDAFH